MPTKIEKLKESLAKAERKADIKRLKKAKGYFDLALETLKKNFSDPEFTNLANEIFDKLDAPCAEIEATIRSDA